MVKKLTLTIPDELYENLSSKRNFVNVSSICSDAIRRFISKADDLSFNAKARFGILSLDEACKRAFNLGMEWAGHKADLHELIFVCSVVNEKWSSFDNEVELLENRYKNVFEYAAAKLTDVIEEILPPFLNEKNEDIEIWVSFAEGAITILKEIEPAIINKKRGEA